MKLATSAFEVNVYFHRDELRSLRDVATADWNSRSSIGAGTSAGSSAWWSSAEGKVSVLIGQDDETWDIGLSGIPIDMLVTAVEEGLALEAQ